MSNKGIRISPDRVKQAEFERFVWAITPDQSTPFETLLSPDYWAHMAYRFKIGDRLEIVAEDFSYVAELMVVDCSRLWAKTVKLSYVQLDTVEKSGAILDGFDVKWTGRHTKWRVVRTSDKAALKDGFSTRGEAEAWLVEHAKAMAA